MHARLISPGPLMCNCGAHSYISHRRLTAPRVGPLVHGMYNTTLSVLRAQDKIHTPCPKSNNTAAKHFFPTCHLEENIDDVKFIQWCLCMLIFLKLHLNERPKCMFYISLTWRVASAPSPVHPTLCKQQQKLQLKGYRCIQEFFFTEPPTSISINYNIYFSIFTAFSVAEACLLCSNYAHFGVQSSVFLCKP